jgi:hypothetical protein
MQEPPAVMNLIMPGNELQNFVAKEPQKLVDSGRNNEDVWVFLTLVCVAALLVYMFQHRKK